MRTVFVLSLTCVMVAGCATNKGKGALVGGGAGAVAGAGIGAVAGGGKGALIGSLIGAAAGAGTGALIGAYMDKQEKELQELKSAKVVRDGDQLVVRFNSAILFDTNKAELKAQSKADLTEFAEVLKKYEDTDLIIEGHTDSTGTREVNERLSEARAQAVIGFLEARGVRGARMEPKAYADTRPIADNTTAEGRTQNRRVQVLIAANEELRKKDAEVGNAPPQR
jgi:outer membrane protein OmpA-like peptidoglycan-associated protein